jgi:26S proteasome regulatory subunit T1
MPKEEQINTKDQVAAKPADSKTDGKKKDVPTDDKGAPLSDSDIALYKRYGKGPYNDALKNVEEEIKTLNQKITEMCGIKESDTGLSMRAQWNLEQDKMMMKEEETLMVGRCIQIINPGTQEAKYVVSFKHIGKYVVGLDKNLAPTDVEEGMRVGCEQPHKIGSKISIKLPLPPKIDPTVTMMTVEDKPDVTYNDIGGCKEQIDKIREVVEMPLLHPERFVQLGIDPPKGVLLYGPPGTGKTLTARAVANRTDACFIRVIGGELN